MNEDHPLNEWIEFSNGIVIKWLENGTTVIVSSMKAPNEGFWCWAALDETGEIWDYRPTTTENPRVLANRQRAMDSADKHLAALVS